VLDGIVGNYRYKTVKREKRTGERIKTGSDGRYILDEYGNCVYEKYEYHTEHEVWTDSWGIRAFFPIPAGYTYSHCDDFGDGRDYKDSTVHEGNDIMAGKGTPVVNIETGTIEDIGWNEYGGWRIGIRSLDGKRYFYYAHLDRYAAYTQQGQRVEAGQVIGYVGDTGYGPVGTSGRFPPHLHVQIEVAYEGGNTVWIDPYHFLRFLEQSRAQVHDAGNGNYISDSDIRVE